MKQYLCVGTYTEPILFGTGEVFQGKGKGIYLCSFEDGKLEVLQQLDLRNPSYLCMDEGYKKIYTVNEMKEYNGAFGGGITQVGYADGTLRKEFDMNTGGTDPCHIEMAPNRKFLSVANFASGAISIFPLDDKGNMTGERVLFQHKGNSVHPIRQKGPHAHGTVFWDEKNWMLIPDLGIDQVKVYAYENEKVIPVPAADIAVEAGRGPRFGEFSNDGKHFYLINELASSVVHYSVEEGQLVWKQEVDTLPDGFPGADNICSDLHLLPDGKYLYASNRGHDSICCFKVQENGNLELVERIACGGKTPRNFCVEPTGKYVLVGNQDSDMIVVFQVGKDGKLMETNRMDFPSPVCIRFF